MQILINSKNEVISFALVGGFEDGVEVTNYPNDFINNFKPRYYVFESNEIKVNKGYKERTDEEYEQPEIDLDENTKGLDKELRNMFASMQVQIVQGNKMVTQLTQQNANLSQQIVQLSQEVEKLKGGNSDETTVSEV